MPILLDGVLALGKGVPQLDGVVPADGDDLPVVSRESDREHILGVVLEPPGGLASAEVPQPEGLSCPRTRTARSVRQRRAPHRR